MGYSKSHSKRKVNSNTNLHFLSIPFPELRRSTIQGWAEARPHGAENLSPWGSMLPLPHAQRVLAQPGICKEPAIYPSATAVRPQFGLVKTYLKVGLKLRQGSPGHTLLSPQHALQRG